MKTYERLRLSLEEEIQQIKKYDNLNVPNVNYPETQKVYSPKSASYDLDKETLKVSYSIREYYKKIVRYKTVNYKRYPVLSSVLLKSVKEKTISYSCPKNIIENLSEISDPVVSNLADKIYYLLNDISLLPKKCQKILLDKYHEKVLEEIRNKKNALSSNKVEINNLKECNNKIENKLNIIDKQIKFKYNQIFQYEEKKAFIWERQKNNFLYYVTLGHYNIDLRIEKINLKIKENMSLIKKNDKEKNKLIEDYNFNSRKICDLNFNLEKELNKILHKEKMEEVNYSQDLANISYPYRESVSLDYPSLEEVSKEEAVIKTYEKKLINLVNFKKIDKTYLINKYDSLPLIAVYILTIDNVYYIGLTFNVKKSLDNFKDDDLNIYIKTFFNKDDAILYLKSEEEKTKAIIIE